MLLIVLVIVVILMVMDVDMNVQEELVGANVTLLMPKEMGAKHASFMQR